MIENWQRGFVLHRRAYSETSLLVDVFTEDAGRLSQGRSGKTFRMEVGITALYSLAVALVGERWAENPHQGRACCDYPAVTTNRTV